ncbi:MAG: hypothetical protein ACKO34_04310 [Vampirovibrionales bacterium]
MIEFILLLCLLTWGTCVALGFMAFWSVILLILLGYVLWQVARIACTSFRTYLDSSPNVADVPPSVPPLQAETLSEMRYH